MVKTISYRTAPMPAATLAPMPALVPVAARAAAPTPPAAAPATSASITQPGDGSRTVVVASAEPGEIAIAGKADPQRTAAKADIAKADIAKADIAKGDIAKADIAKADIVKADIAKPEPAPPQAHGRGGWLIQIGAYDAEAEARQHLSAAQSQAHATLGAAEPFTERVQKGDKALYRARFAGFDRGAAEAACRELKRSDFECMAVKN
jgi:D-alanyl-D-alanine carboxypeptidase